MMQQEETITCTSSVTAVRCGLFFSDRDKPKHNELREFLKPEFPLGRRQPLKVGRDAISGFRPRRAFFQADCLTFAWQEGGAVYLQSEEAQNKAKFMRDLESVIRACKATRPFNSEPFNLSVTVINRFEFTPFERDQFELHRFFTIAPQASAEISRQQLFLYQGELNLKFADYGYSEIALQLRYPGFGAYGTTGVVGLTIESSNPFVATLEDASQKAASEWEGAEKVTFDATTKELRQLLNWI